MHTYKSGVPEKRTSFCNVILSDRWAEFTENCRRVTCEDFQQACKSSKRSVAYYTSIAKFKIACQKKQYQSWTMRPSSDH